MRVSHENAVESIGTIATVAVKALLAFDAHFDAAKESYLASMRNMALDDGLIAAAEEDFEIKRAEQRDKMLRRTVSEALHFWAKQNGTSTITFTATPEEPN